MCNLIKSQVMFGLYPAVSISLLGNSETEFFRG